jgi:Na+/H+-dicarboxylate symporter
MIAGVIIGLTLGFIFNHLQVSSSVMKVILLPGKLFKITLFDQPFQKKKGDLFLRALKMLVVPLVFGSVTGIETKCDCSYFSKASMASLGGVQKGKVGRRAILWYLTTTVNCFKKMICIHSSFR